MNSSVMIDLVIGGVLLAFAYLGWRRGLFRSLAELGVMVLALVLSAQIASAAAPEIVDRALRPATYAAIEQQVDKMLAENVQNLSPLEELEQVELPVTEKRFGEAVAAAVAEGKNPVHASLEGKGGNLYERAAAISEYYHSSELWKATVGDITARRQLEEVRLRMTAEVNVKLLKSGFSIDTAPMEELIEALKLAENQLADQYFPRDDMAVEKYHSYRRVSTLTDQMPGLPADVLGIFAKGRGGASLETIYNEGRALQDNYEKAQKS